MTGIKNLLFIYLLRIPYCLVIYTVLILFTGNYSVFPILLITFSILCIFDVFCKKIAVIIAACTIISAIVFSYIGMIEMTAAVLCLLFYKPEQYNKGGPIMIGILFVLSVVMILFTEPMYAYICIRNVVTATAATILARQIQTLDRFINSYYCREVSSKTASKIIKRSYILTISCLAIFIITGFSIRPVGSAIPIPQIILNRIENAFDSTEVALITNDPENTDEIPDERDEIHILLLYESEERDANIIYPFLIVGVVIITTVIIILLVKLYRPGKQFDDYDEIIEETFIKSDKKTELRKRVFIFGTNQKVRKLFKRKVKEYMIDQYIPVRKSDTPENLATVINDRENIEALKNLYHKARYSDEHIERAELKVLYSDRNKVRNG